MQIEGLTERQVELLDIMWSIEEFTDLEMWMSTLTRAERLEAENLQRLIILEGFEEILDLGQYPDARRVIDKIRKL